MTAANQLKEPRELEEVPVPDDILRIAGCKMRCGEKTVLQFYLERVAAGMSPSFAQTLALQESPGIGITTAIFLQDQRRWGSSIAEQYKNTPRELEDLRQSLARNGYKLKSDDQYIRTASRFPGDPAAIVNETQSFQEVEKRVSERVKRSRDEGPMKKVHRLNPKIVDQVQKQMIKRDPDLAHKDQSELREQIIDKHGSKGDTV